MNVSIDYISKDCMILTVNYATVLRRKKRRKQMRMKLLKAGAVRSVADVTAWVCSQDSARHGKNMIYTVALKPDCFGKKTVELAQKRAQEGKEETEWLSS